jgi:hypothetical protein
VENCKAWNAWNSADIPKDELHCDSCSAVGSFSFSETPIPITCWDVVIPQDWEYGQWNRIRLFPIQVHTYQVKCASCGTVSRVYPSFIIKGSTLTLQALIFIVYVYATGQLTWRDMSERFCPETDRIAHSTLYKVVHGLGKSLLMQEDKVQEGLRKLHAAYAHASGSLPGSLPGNLSGSISDVAIQGISGIPLFKARLPHTRAQERALHDLILPLSWLRVSEPLFLRAFFVFIKPVRLIQSALSPPICKLYMKPLYG